MQGGREENTNHISVYSWPRVTLWAINCLELLDFQTLEHQALKLGLREADVGVEEHAFRLHLCKAGVDRTLAPVNEMTRGWELTSQGSTGGDNFYIHINDNIYYSKYPRHPSLYF